MPADPKLIPEILRRWGVKQKRRLRQAFAVGGHQNHGGERWTPLDPESGPGLPLTATGSLRASLFFRVSGVSLLLGSNSKVAIYHQNGTKTIPKRPIVVITRQDLNELKTDLKRTLER